METKKIYLIFGILAIIGLFFALKFHSLAFPIASMEMNFDKEKALEITEKYLRENNFSTKGYMRSAVFSPNSLDMLFLERSLGLEQANKMIENKTVSIWNWEIRYFQQFNPEEYYFCIDTETGEIVFFNHIVEDIKPGENLDFDEAKIIAESCFNNTGISLEAYELVESSSEKREARTDHFFEWKKKDFNIPWKDGGHGYLKIKISIYGGEVGNYKIKYIDYPENFERNIDEQFSLGNFINMIVLTISLIIILVIFLLVFIKKFLKKEDIIIKGVRWKLFLYISIFIFLVKFIDSINSIPIAISNYTTTKSYINYFGTYIMNYAGFALFYAISVFIIGSFGEFISKEVYPKSSRFFDYLRSKDYSKHVRTAVIIGLMLALIDLGFVSLFYMFGNKYFGVWRFIGSSYSGVFDNFIPFLCPLAIGLSASIREEFQYRLFLIPSTKKYFKLGFLALIIPALLWSFAHSHYAIFPVYMRGIEIGIIGIIFGLVYIRFGILAVLISHCVYNTIVGSIPMLTSGNPYYIIVSSIVILIVPLSIFLLTFFRKK